ncbi:MAG: gliding motility-associated C-terminal domain-containing protein, partial [Bacteroidales bacterium]|nr:gliding motility-associated C-terminal domain-containing protein [Bacteroidales bacterium]
LHGMQEGVIFKLDYNMRNLLWSTYMGGKSDDAVYSIEVDSQYNLLACGGTSSPDFPTTPGAYNNDYNGGTVDGFVCKISYNGDQLMASTYFGSDAYDQCYFVRRGKNSDVFIFGQTKASGSTLIHNANYNTPNSGQFIAHLAPELDSLVWSTVFGTGNGKPNISPTAFVADLCNRVYAVGWGRDFVGYYDHNRNPITWRTGGTTDMEVTPDAYESNTDGQDFYIMSLSMDASTLDYATFFGEVNDAPPGYVGGYGGDHVDGGTSRFDRLGVLYQSVCGSCGRSQYFPTTPNAWSRQNRSGNCNNAVFRFQIHADFPLAEFSPVPVGCAPYNVQFVNTGRGTSFEWDFGDGTTSTERDPQHTYEHGGEYTVRLVARQLYGCSEVDSTSRTIRVLENNSRRLPPVTSCVFGQPVQIGFTPMTGCQYHWLQTNVSDPTIANPNVVESGTYILQITQQELLDAAGCIETDTFDVIYYDLLDTLYTFPPLCAYDSFGHAIAQLSPNATGTITYTWDGLSTGSNTLYHIANTTQRHLLRVSNEYCSVDKYFTIHTPSPILNKDGNIILCDGCDGYIEISMSDPRSDMAYSYLWNDGTTSSSREGLCEGAYAVAVSDTNNCTYHDTTRIMRSNTFNRPIQVWADDTVVIESFKTTLHVTPISGCTYEWSPSKHMTDATTANPTVKVYEPTTYTVTLTDPSGCHYRDSVRVGCEYIDCGKESLFIPNAFSPNGDGQNDRFCIRNDDPITHFYIAIFTRWGELVYESNDISQCWDGRYNGNPCLPAAYYYTCRYTCVEGKSSERKGDITLIR